jgi:aspartate aminotransferase-like enzyme
MTQRELFTPDRLFCPGPTPVPRAVAQAGVDAGSSIYHRSDEFYKVFRRAAELLKPLFGTTESPLILASSGTGAMEAAVVNLTAPGDAVVVVKAGKFGERWEKLTKAYECKVEVIAVAAGKAVSPADVLAAVERQKDTRAVLLQANETSTGVAMPVALVARELRSKGYKGLIIVDAISSLGAHVMRQDEWDVDAVVAGSQKGFGLPPGLAFVSLTKKAWGQLSRRPRFYFDLERERKGQAEGRSAWTPASTLVFSLREALEQIDAIGAEGFAAHHAQLARAARAAAKALKLELFAGAAPSDALTVFSVPAAVDGQKLVKRLRQRFGMFFAGGQDELKGKIVRFAHLGFVSRFDLIDGLAALEFALHEEGYPLSLGSGVAAAMQSLASTP